MSDILWSDVSEWQVPVDDTYPFEVLAVRSNDGTYRDHHFIQNYTWGISALESGRLRVLIVYLVYRQDWQQDVDTLVSQIGATGFVHPGVVVMIDVESWGGQITGDNSAGINAMHGALSAWIGDSRRVIGYGNVFDLDSLWPSRPADLRLVVAAYGSNPAFPGKLGHQFTDGATTDHLFVPPFGYADVNSADGYDLDSFCTALGLDDMSARAEQLIQEIHDEIYRLLPTRAGPGPNPTYTDTTLGYAANADGFGWRIEQRMVAIQAAFWTLIQALVAKGIIDSTLAAEYTKLLDLPAWPAAPNPFA